MTMDRAFIKAFSDVPPAARPHCVAKEADAATIISQEAIDEAPQEPAFLANANAIVSPTPASDRPRRPLPVRTLSSFAPVPDEADRLQPAVECEELAWPKACLELASRARRGWEAFIDRLLEPAAEGNKCFAIASCVRGEGRTTAVLTAARLLADRGLHTVLVDADFENPCLAQSLGAAPRLGWGDVIAAGLPLGEALVAAPADKITLLPWHAQGAHAAAPTNLTRIAGCFEKLREHFDVILVDAMPLASGPAVTNLARLAEPMRIDALYLIYDSRFTTPKQLKDVSSRLQLAGLPPAGAIENFVEPPQLVEAGTRQRLPSFAGRPLSPHA
jgi:Mrp family chromosome partitioning ATPase